MDDRGFLEVETPILQAEAGGAAARPFVTHHQALARALYLRIATELHLKRLIAGGLDRVYETGRAFRNEGLSSKHNPEFTLLESYEAYADYNDVAAMVEEMVSTVAQDVLGKTRVSYGDDEIGLKPPWRRLRVQDALAEHAGLDLAQHWEEPALRAWMKDREIEIPPGASWARLVAEGLSTCVGPRLLAPAFSMGAPRWAARRRAQR